MAAAGAAAARVRLLRLLKTGRAPTLAACAALLSYSPCRLAHWWAAYRVGRLAALSRERLRPGEASRLTAEARAGLEDEMRVGGSSPSGMRGATWPSTGGSRTPA